jgi:hypothetical protein
VVSACVFLFFIKNIELWLGFAVLSCAYGTFPGHPTSAPAHKTEYSPEVSSNSGGWVFLQVQPSLLAKPVMAVLLLCLTTHPEGQLSLGFASVNCVVFLPTNRLQNQSSQWRRWPGHATERSYEPDLKVLSGSVVSTWTEGLAPRPVGGG